MVDFGCFLLVKPKDFIQFAQFTLVKTMVLGVFGHKSVNKR